jgi:hypothetical protein
MKPTHDEIGVGAAESLSLRVSVATLVRVVFKHPKDGDLMLALERKATLHETGKGHAVEVKAQPFGGAIRILDPMKLRGLIGNFHFDSEHSRSEQDFRIFIRPSDWSAVREFCMEHLNHVDDPVLETDPARELSEELFDALKIHLKREQYVRMPVATLVENKAAPTENVHAKGHLTARVYRIFEARILDLALSHAMLTNSEGHSNLDLQQSALENARNGGEGRANAMLALPLKRISEAYLAMRPDARNSPISFEDQQLDSTVAAILEGVSVPKYQRLPRK